MFIVARESSTIPGQLRVIRNVEAAKGQSCAPLFYAEELEASLHADAMNAEVVAQGGTPGTFKVYRVTECVTVPDPIATE